MCFSSFTDAPTTEISTLSLHDALPISPSRSRPAITRSSSPSHGFSSCWLTLTAPPSTIAANPWLGRSEEHTSELQSHSDLVCRLLLEKKKKKIVTKKRRQ